MENGTGPKMLHRKYICSKLCLSQLIHSPVWLGMKRVRVRDCRAYPNDMVHRVDVTVAHVHPDGSDGETVVLPWTVDDHGLMGTGRGRWGVSAGRGVPWRRRVRGQGVGWHWTSQWRNGEHICNTEAGRQNPPRPHCRACSQPSPRQPCWDREHGGKTNTFMFNKKIKKQYKNISIGK